MELELRGITKRFGPLVANDGISLSVAPGQVHALLGENGAGKTTLMNVLFGLTQPDQGEIHIDGKAASFRSPKDAIAAGIGMVHQHFMLVPVFTVAVANVVTQAQSGSFKGGTYVGTLQNGGAILSPFHDFASVVPASLQSELKTVQAGIEGGSIQTPTKSPV